MIGYSDIIHLLRQTSGLACLYSSLTSSLWTFGMSLNWKYFCPLPAWTVVILQLYTEMQNVDLNCVYVCECVCVCVCVWICIWLMGQQINWAEWALCVFVCVCVWHTQTRPEGQGKRSAAPPAGGAVSPGRGVQQANRGVPVHPSTQTPTLTLRPTPPCCATRRVGGCRDPVLF